MIEEDVFRLLASAGVVPVVVIEQLEHALPLADALIAGGLPVMEVTFRTQAAADVIRLVKSERPSMLIGAGTVLTVDQLRAAKEAGAQFAVAPGCNPEIVALARQLEIPFIPGICTPSDIECAVALGCRLLKFFPSEAMGGLATLTAIATPYRHLNLRFMPSGGISSANMEAYLASDLVVAVGGTWIAKPEDLTAGQWSTIRDRSHAAVASVKRLRSHG